MSNCPTCAVCGAAIADHRPSRPRKYCSVPCFRASTHRRVAWKCLTCAREVVTIPSQVRKYCSAACVGVAFSGPHGPRRRPRPLRECYQCGDSFRFTKKGGRIGKFCSRRCSFESMRFVKIARRATELCQRAWGPKPKSRCIGCDREFEQGPRKRRCCGNGCRKAVEREKQRASDMARHSRICVCSMCGDRFAPAYGDKRRDGCGEACLRALRANRRRTQKARRRARKRGVHAETVDPFRVFRRDGWRCRLCGVKTPRKLRGTTHDCAPELDHVIPLSKGGPHSYDNVQTACRRCNGVKGDAVAGQVSLFAAQAAWGVRRINLYASTAQ
jgi:5-methylcytosine-specific restriction endonuclease McrA